MSSHSLGKGIMFPKIWWHIYLFIFLYHVTHQTIYFLALLLIYLMEFFFYQISKRWNRLFSFKNPETSAEKKTAKNKVKKIIYVSFSFKNYILINKLSLYLMCDENVKTLFFIFGRLMLKSNQISNFSNRKTNQQKTDWLG